MTEGDEEAETRAQVLAMALSELRRAEMAAAGQSWKDGLRACRRMARFVRLNAHERLLAAALAQAVQALMPLAGAHPQRVRQLLELLDEAVEAQPHDIDLAHALHDVLLVLARLIDGEEGPDERRKQALARLGLTYLRPLCSRFPGEVSFAETRAVLERLTPRS